MRRRAAMVTVLAALTAVLVLPSGAEAFQPPVQAAGLDFGPTARAFHSVFWDRVDVAMLVLCVMFVLPFLDPRRPFRMLHLDLVAFLAFQVSFVLLEDEHLAASVTVQYVPLLYLLTRLLCVGFRGGAVPGPAVPYASDRLLAAGLVALVAGRLAFNVVWGAVGDVGYAGLVGADAIRHGYELYGSSIAHLDTYGPINYLFYLPFEALFPLGPGLSHHNVQGAHLVTLTLDLAVIGLLMLVGRKLSPGAGGRRLGLTLAYAWAAYPFAFLPVAVSANDEMVAVAVLVALLLYDSAAGRGVALGLGAAVRIAPLALVPLFAPGRARSLRSAIVCGGLAAAIFVLAFVPYVRETSLGTVWDSTIGYQMNRNSPFTLWGLHPSLEWVHVLAQALAVGLVVLVGFVPRTRSPLRIAALAGAVVLAVQMAGTYWAHTYVAWFAAPAFVGLLGRHAWPAEREPATEPGPAPRSAAREPLASA